MDPVSRQVFGLLEIAMQKTSADAVILERDNNSASTFDLTQELRAIRSQIERN